MTQEEKTQNLKRAIGEYFDVPEELVVTFVVGVDHKSDHSEVINFSSVYFGLTSNWAIGNLRAIERHIETDQAKAAMEATLDKMASDNNGEI